MKSRFWLGTKIAGRVSMALRWGTTGDTRPGVRIADPIMLSCSLTERPGATPPNTAKAKSASLLCPKVFPAEVVQGDGQIPTSLAQVREL